MNPSIFRKEHRIQWDNGKIVNGKAVTLNGESMGKVVRGISAGDPIHKVAEIADVVRDKNGKVIGRVIDGQVIDAEGSVIGKVVNGRAVSATGEALGLVERGVALDASGQEVDLSSSSASARPARVEKIVRDASGNVVGRVVDGKVVDESGKVIGTVDDSGNAVSLSGRKLGRAEDALVNDAGMVVGKPVDVVRDANGEIVGRIEDGKVVDKNGKRAITFYRTIDNTGNKSSWLAMMPETGRTHQLRVHCAELGTPILGDGKYGGAGAFLEGASGIERKLHLHAKAIKFPHPGGGFFQVVSDLSPHMIKSWKYLGFDEKLVMDPFEDFYEQWYGDDLG